MREKFLPDQELDELNDTNSFLSQAINSAVKDLEHSEVDPDFFLPEGSGQQTAQQLWLRQDKLEKYKDTFDFEIVEQVINECLLPQPAEQYRRLLEHYAGVEKESKKNEFNKKKR